MCKIASVASMARVQKNYVNSLISRMHAWTNLLSILTKQNKLKKKSFMKLYYSYMELR